MLMIADPQLTDQNSYQQTGLSLLLTQFYSDIYMKYNYKSILSLHAPNSVMFLGDLMDGGRQWDNNT
jgi:hypothetical protein